MFAAISYDPIVSIGLGPLSISPHGIFTAIGVLVGAMLLLRETRAVGLDDAAVSEVLTRSVIAALIGARLAYVVNHLARYDSPLEVLRIWEGGASLLGGITAALLVATVEFRRRHLPGLRLLDLAAPWFTLGIAIGRIGDLLIADHLGDPTSSPLGFRCPDVVDVGRTVGSPCQPGEVVHLTAAYDLVAALAITVVVLAIRKRFTAKGTAIASVGILYGIDRLVLDDFRADAVRFGLTGSQWTGIALILAGLIVLATGRARSSRSASQPEPSEGPAAGTSTSSVRP